MEWAKSYLLHLAAVLDERLRLRFCPQLPRGSALPAAALLSIMQRAHASLALAAQFNATDVAAAAHLPRLLHPAACLADSIVSCGGDLDEARAFFERACSSRSG